MFEDLLVGFALFGGRGERIGLTVAGVAWFEEGEVALDVAGGARAAGGGEANVGGHDDF